MTSNIKLAWRNLWRNKRRTLITVASIFFGVLLSAYMTSMQEGSYSKMVEIVVKFYSGYMQVHQEDYWEYKSINNVFDYDEALVDQIKKHKEVDYVIPRLESFGLASAEDLTRGAALFGVVPDIENNAAGPQLVDRALEDDFAASRTGARPEVDDVIGDLDGLWFVLDHQHGVALVPQLTEQVVHPLDIVRVQADCGLVEARSQKRP
jgi:ABC-type lipoprotein release transport system permease subunit